MRKLTKELKDEKRAYKPRHSEIGLSIIEGLKQAVAHHRGEIELRTTSFAIPDPVDVRAVREGLGLSQSQFAARYGFSPRTLQQWEQGRSKPDGVARAYLTVIERNPRAVERALKVAS
jgi:putative transcriptional regulator